MTLGGTAAVLAIDGYRRFVSPYKGFTCAHNKVHGDGSCSDYGRDAFKRYGVRAGLRLMRVRFEECKAAAGTIQAMANPPTFGGQGREESEEEEAKKKKKSNNCDFDCSPPSNCGGSPRSGNAGPGDCNLTGLGCSPPSGAVDVCSVSDACSCSL